MRKACVSAVSWAMLALLAACGGGNSGPAAPSNPPIAPSITTQPSGQTAAVGQSATFTVAASGTAPLTYQWERGSAAIAGATSASYTTPALAALDDGASFTVIVSNSAGSVTSNAAKLTVTAPVVTAPSITTQPANQTAAVGQTATFTVVAAGTAPLTYQWKRGSVAIAGATSASYTTPALAASDDGGSFTVVVSNSAGSVTSNAARLTVTVPVTAPSITTQPANQTAAVGQTATFTVVAAGTAPLSYQWKRGGAAIAGATSASYTTPVLAASDNGGSFTVVVSNSAGSVTSAAAKLSVTSLGASVDVTTYKNDLARTGQNLHESLLSTASVTVSNFGVLRTLPVDGKVDAQPLYLSKLVASGGVHSVVYVATEHDSVYAFDADSGTVLWQVSLLGAGETVSDAPSCPQVVPEIGITSTPVIDRNAGAHGIIYVVAMSRDKATASHQRLHALDLTTGAELLNGPVEITATFPNKSGMTAFDPGQYEERAALLLLNGTVYTSWTSHCDIQPYTGWIIGYSGATLSRTSILNVAPNSSGGPAIWMSGGGPAADANGNIYLLTANGAFETTLDVNGFPSFQDYGNSFLKLATGAGSVSVADYFAMKDEVLESGMDVDLGSGGAMLLPDVIDVNNTVKHLVVGAGKDSNLYVVDRDSMGHFDATQNHIWQQLTGALSGGILSTPAYFNGRVYYGPIGGPLKAFTIANAKLSVSPASQTSTHFAYPGTAPSISANGTANGIVWAHENTNPAVLHAYDATNLANELYNSNQAAGGRDHFGAGNKFISPMIADGKVFVGTTAGVAVFGLLH